LLAKIDAMNEKDKNLDRLQKENEILKAKVVKNIENEEINSKAENQPESEK